MSFKTVSSGKNLPEDVYVIIEIPCNSDPIKYEIDKKTNVFFVDRFINTAMFYPCNYGYINNTLSLDGDPLDVLVPTPYPLRSSSVILCRPVGMLNMIDESGDDKKIIAVPHKTISQEYENIKNIEDVSKLLRLQIVHFFEHYKDLEKNKWVKIIGWSSIETAKEEIINSFKRFHLRNKKST
ncbi:inorganic diphosphatase [Candidatus Tachikawaea gelatinosa]|uniref:Inorganic pyrophosphatase n=1 Tax=Candidatus Tachikawaea gelatinosa TaxID=1410383 RepID=A0A090ARC3_9ENTR|nr:inorganic diphosphatase [Candidatus Tachikawaea gelatinosa]BAP58305.1 inorganic pyrophosphatase [Candidatus Tachikawaea gelatinosa]